MKRLLLLLIIGIISLNAWSQENESKAALEARKEVLDREMTAAMNKMIMSVDINDEEAVNQLISSLLILAETHTKEGAELQRRIAAAETAKADAPVPVTPSAPTPAPAAPTAAAPAPATPPAARELARLPGRLLWQGFDRGSSLLGNWRKTERGISQADPSHKFAKYSFPVEQQGDQLLFGFSAETKPDGDWLGYGLHFLAGREKTGKGYGFGDSYLIWITRDPQFYQTAKTHLQLYRSRSDTEMIQLASYLIPETAESLDIEVWYDGTARRITAYVNGSARFEYFLEQLPAGGMGVALRTLGGPVEFTDLYLKTE